VQELWGSIARQTAKLANGNIPYDRRPAGCIKEGWLGAGFSFLLSLFCEFESSLFWEFELFREFCLFQKFHKICKICEFKIPQLLLGDWLQISHQVVTKLYCVWFDLHIHYY